MNPPSQHHRQVQKPKGYLMDGVVPSWLANFCLGRLHSLRTSYGSDWSETGLSLSWFLDMTSCTPNVSIIYLSYSWGYSTASLSTFSPTCHVCESWRSGDGLRQRTDLNAANLSGMSLMTDWIWYAILCAVLDGAVKSEDWRSRRLKSMLRCYGRVD